MADWPSLCSGVLFGLFHAGELLVNPANHANLREIFAAARDYNDRALSAARTLLMEAIELYENPCASRFSRVFRDFKNPEPVAEYFLIGGLRPREFPQHMQCTFYGTADLAIITGAVLLQHGYVHCDWDMFDEGLDALDHYLVPISRETHEYGLNSEDAHECTRMLFSAAGSWDGARIERSRMRRFLGLIGTLSNFTYVEMRFSGVPGFILSAFEHATAETKELFEWYVNSDACSFLDVRCGLRSAANASIQGGPGMMNIFKSNGGRFTESELLPLEPWTPTRHSAMGPDVFTAIKTVLLCAKRRRLFLPTELWFTVFEFMKRYDFVSPKQ